jgi:hypothetical protein
MCKKQETHSLPPLYSCQMKMFKPCHYAVRKEQCGRVSEMPKHHVNSYYLQILSTTFLKCKVRYGNIAVLLN